MKIIECPLNGPRNAQEFVFGGDVINHPNPHLISDDQWANYVFIEENRAGVVQEWWCHVPTAYWFIAERDTVKDEILRTFDPSEIYKERIDYNRPEVEAQSQDTKNNKVGEVNSTNKETGSSI
tara:strand:- start:10178 stop:10546 length:369 start_codon:yes stop_codon:yes gene_type:complete